MWVLFELALRGALYSLLSFFGGLVVATVFYAYVHRRLRRHLLRRASYDEVSSFYYEITENATRPNNSSGWHEPGKADLLLCSAEDLEEARRKDIRRALNQFAAGRWDDSRPRIPFSS